MRQLPTNHDYDGEAAASIHEYQSDQPSTMAAPAAVHWRLNEDQEDDASSTSVLDRSFHISGEGKCRRVV